jgi:hypothetical protein
VREALAYVEREAGVTRRGAGGVVSIAGRGLIGAAFRHRTSRAGDPQLHTHVLVANLVLGADGGWGTLDGRRIYAHAKTAGYLYEHRLRALLTRELGFEWEPVRNGIADVVGVGPEVRRAFSRRRAEIEAEMARRGTSTRRGGAGRGARDAAGQGLPGRDGRAPAGVARAGRRAGLGERGVREVVGRALVPEFEGGQVDELLARLGGPDGLTKERSSFARREVLQALAEGLPAGADVGIGELEELADRFLASERVVVLADGERRGEVVGVDGRVVVTGPASERRYSTPELLERERRVLDYAEKTQGQRVGVGRESAVDRSIRRRPTIAGEQAEMVRRLVLDGDGVAVVIGQAGTGKTFALDAAREAWEGSGYRVIGAALARRAAIELEDGAEIESGSIAALLEELRKRPLRVLPRRSVLVVDEAGMVPTRALAELVDHVERAGAKLVLVGDNRQLPEIGAGGTFGALARRLPAIELRENRRQSAVWEREALALLRDGDADGAVRRYAERGRIVSGEDDEAVRGRLVEDWWQAGDPDDAVMIAHRRRDVGDLNGRAHALMRAAGALGEEGEAGLAVGDRVVMRRNDRQLGVVNGERGTVVGVDGGDLEVEIRGQRVQLDREYVEDSVSLGYAITGHAAQGMTCGQTFILATAGLSKEWAYVALSRGREANRLYVTREARESAEFMPNRDGTWRPADVLREGLTRSAAHELATERQWRGHGIER